ncbi:hemin transporter [Bibersteinia trehalosi Y31]|uniref:Hemin transporter n=1 Tax=Bibersteinia trehalosi Y31 TaxID=1261658 RepID=A0A179D0S1_BIBTR|nr:ShlB/FhaC/HecB family hemolysin secretion/activation protein [Bibersteinia trehalosi]OAQ15387.1 hemin transporter [Bibersteinia trehalosi Y31]
MRWLLFLFSLCLLVPNSLSSDSLEQESIRLMQDQLQREKIFTAEPELYSSSSASPISDFLIEETPCFPINQIKLHHSSDKTFSFLIPKLYKRLSIRSSLCVGEKNLKIIQDIAQNILIEEGFITSHIYFDNQDLNNQILYLSVQAGYLNQIRFIDHNHKLTILGRKTVFPLQEGRILNLFDMEQGLENIQRLSYTETSINIEPSYKDGYSDLIVNRIQNKQFELGIGIDSLGSKNSGRYQAETSLSVYSLFGFNDLFYTQYHQDLGHHKTKLIDSQGNRTDSSSKGYSLHYSLPIGYWVWQTNYSLNRYADATEGLYRNYNYNGKTYHFNTLLNRAIFRNGKHKTNLSGKLWHTKIQKFLDRYEIEVQRRKMSGWEISLSHLIQQADYRIEGKLNYKRGVGFHSIPAPEEFNEENDILTGTARMKIISAELNLKKSFNLFDQAFSVSHLFYSQWNKTPLVPQDKLNLGNYYTVRGFDGDSVIQGERGWYSQNNLHWHYFPNHQIYLGLDYGHISGKTGKLQNKQTISGAVVGISGNLKIHSNQFDYHLFISQPLKPRRHKSLLGFSTHYYF